MGRKMTLVLLACLLLVPLGTAKASAVYDGTISTTYLTIFKDALASVPVTDDYVFYRSDEYEYVMVTGDIEYNGTMFQMFETGTAYILNYQTSGYNQPNYYHWDVVEYVGFGLDPTDHLVYSNLGDFPRLEGRGDVYEFSTLVLCASVSLCMLLRSLFGFVYRNRGRGDNCT